MHWYVRHKNRVLGPFPAGQISQSLLLGRLSLRDLISKDKESWYPIADFPELVPDILWEDPSDEQVQERLAAARRWADERRQERRDPQFPERLVSGRRGGEDDQTLEYRQARESTMHQLRRGAERHWGGLIVVLIVLLGGVYAGFGLVPERPAQPDCNAPAAPGVNWRYCNMGALQQIKANLAGANLHSAYLSGANLFGSNLARARLSYANLTEANLSFVEFTGADLKGATLRGADLTEADLGDTNLSYANLHNAVLEGANLRGARLDHAIWLDGRQCAPGSVGACRALK